MKTVLQIKHLLQLFGLMIFSFGLIAQNKSEMNPEVNARMKTNFIYSYTKYIEWPDINNFKSFKIIVLGQEAELVKALKNFSSNKEYRIGVPIKIQQTNSTKNIPKAQIIYFNARSGYDIDLIMDIAIKNNCLVITEGYGFGKSMINFVEVNHSQKFEISESSLSEAGLKVNNYLRKIAVKNETEWNNIINKRKIVVKDGDVTINKKDFSDILKERNQKLDAIKNQDKLLASKAALLKKTKKEIKDQQQSIKNQQEELNTKKREFENLDAKFSDKSELFDKQSKKLIQQQLVLNKQKKQFKFKQKQINEQVTILRMQKEEIKQQQNKLAISSKKIDNQSVEIEKQEITIYISIGILLLVIIFSFFIYKSYKDKKKSNLLISKQKELVEEKNQEIMDSFIYAKRIQSAILPAPLIVKEYLKESFVLYKPKDIVAGDFYWMHKNRSTDNNSESSVLFAAADCTGHGVPGAMVSVVCNNALNRSVREYGLTDPGLILDKTREIVIDEFEKSEDDVKDGMDIALCSIEGDTLKYAGANNPLWVIRNNEVLETKANKEPIGQFDKLTPYTTHSFKLQKGDSVYIFSDGYVDQFGGEKGKKFKPQAFRELLLSIQKESMEEQNKLIDACFENWRGNIEQIDDVCVIGVKI